MDGWVKLWRVLLEKPIWKNSTPEQKVVMVTLLLMANHKSSEWEWMGDRFSVEPGQFVTSLESIRKKAGYGISIQNVRSALRRFKTLDFLTNKSTKAGRLISIVNWDSYQPAEGVGQQSSQQRGNKGVTPNKNERMKEFTFKVKVEIPKNIYLTDNMVTYAKNKGIESDTFVEDLFEGFCVYHKQHGSKFKDWNSAWQTWARNEVKFNPDKYKKVEKIYEPDSTSP